MYSIFSEFKSLTKLFRDNNIRYALIGGSAILSYDNFRTTNDFDFVVNISHYELDKLSKLFSDAFEYCTCNIHHTIMTVNLRFITMDIIPVGTIFEERCLKMSKEKNYFTTKCKVARLEDLLLLKLSICDTEERHYKDVLAICKNCKDKINISYLKRSIRELKIVNNVCKLENLLGVKLL